jgi:hypothetical protein
MRQKKQKAPQNGAGKRYTGAGMPLAGINSRRNFKNMPHVAVITLRQR